MIKTIIAGEDLVRALARQQAWVDRHYDDKPPDASTASIDTKPSKKLRMAKADVRRGGGR